MGMFDNIRCKYPLPVELPNSGADVVFQTKSLDCGMLDFEIREDGTLWGSYQVFDDDDDSHNHWVFEDEFIGEIRFYCVGANLFRSALKTQYADFGWVEFSAYFVHGHLKNLVLVTYRKPQSVVLTDSK